MNSLTALLWMVMLWQHSNPCYCVQNGMGWSVCSLVCVQDIVDDIPDVAPVEWRQDNNHLPERQRGEHRYSCMDTSRFLLMSEDGRWHCLKLTPKVRWRSEEPE